jgi:hypothetical protein
MAISKGNINMKVALQVAWMPYTNDKFGIALLNGDNGSLNSLRLLSPAYIPPLTVA